MATERTIFYIIFITLNLYGIIGLIKNRLFIPGIHSKPLYLTGLTAVLGYLFILFFTICFHFILKKSELKEQNEYSNFSIYLFLFLGFLCLFFASALNLIQ